MSTITPEEISTSETGKSATKSGRWPLYGVLGGVTGLAATMFTSQMIEPEVKAQGVDAVWNAFDDRALVQAGASLGFVTVLLLVAFAAGYLRYLERTVGRDNTWVGATRLGLAGSIGAMTITFGMKAMLAGGMPGGVDENLYTRTDVTVLHLLVDQLQWVGWWGLAIAMMCAVPLTFRAKALPSWIGFVSAVFGAFVAFMTIGLALPYSAGVVGGLWLALASLSLIRRAKA